MLRPLESFFRREPGSATSRFFPFCLTVASLVLLSKLTSSITAKDSFSDEAIGLDSSEEAEWKLASEVEGDGRCCTTFEVLSIGVAGIGDDDAGAVDDSGKTALVAEAEATSELGRVNQG